MSGASRRADDERYMRRALELAELGRGNARPNPMVGAVIVRDGEVVAEGFHARPGEHHAEVVALAAAGERARGAEMYVTLEPCSHYGRTPPCCDAVIEAGIARVVAGMMDPNPQVAGRGFARLRDAGVDVEVGVLDTACRRLNEDWAVYITEKRPFVTAKLAMSLDGRTATKTGNSQWISSAASRDRVHRMRSASHAIMVGTGTLLADNPRLTARPGGEEGGPTPHRYALDARLAVPDSAAILDVEAAPTTLFTGPNAARERRSALQARGVRVIDVPSDASGRLDLRACLHAVAADGCLSLMVEGGGELVGALVDTGLLDRLVLHIAPVVIGGRGARAAVVGAGVERVADALRATHVRSESVGGDVHLVADFRG